MDAQGQRRIPAAGAAPPSAAVAQELVTVQLRPVPAVLPKLHVEAGPNVGLRHRDRRGRGSGWATAVIDGGNCDSLFHGHAAAAVAITALRREAKHDGELPLNVQRLIRSDADPHRAITTLFAPA